MIKQTIYSPCYGGGIGNNRNTPTWLSVGHLMYGRFVFTHILEKIKYNDFTTSTGHAN